MPSSLPAEKGRSGQGQASWPSIVRRLPCAHAQPHLTLHITHSHRDRRWHRPKEAKELLSPSQATLGTRSPWPPTTKTQLAVFVSPRTPGELQLPACPRPALTTLPRGRSGSAPFSQVITPLTWAQVLAVRIRATQCGRLHLTNKVTLLWVLAAQIRADLFCWADKMIWKKQTNLNLD